jgi:beta-glucanase (GH16 family)
MKSSLQNSSLPPARTPTDPGFHTTAALLKKYQIKDKSQYVSQEFQDFGYRLAVALNDLPHKSLYIKMAKKIERGILESALSFVSDSNARNKAKLFMWKVKKLQENIKTLPQPQL